MTDAEVFGDFGIKMLQTGLKQQYDGFIRLNEVHQQQMQKLADENVRLHRHNVELASENAYLRRKVDEAKVLKTLMSMGGAAAEEEEDASPPSVSEEAEGNTATPNARPTFASVVAPGASALTDGLVADARRWSWMFLYEADQPIGATELNRLHPIFIRRVDSVRVDRGFYVALAQLSYRASCTRMVRELLKLVEAGVVKENTLSVEWAQHYGMDSWLDLAEVANADQCDGRTALLNHMRAWNKRRTVVCCDGRTVRFPFQKVKA